MLKGVTTMLLAAAWGLVVDGSVAAMHFATAPWTVIGNSKLHKLNLDSTERISSMGLLGAH